ncbi:type I-E CRISPR-associated protein Cse1/CasA [Kitasatospora sp. NPDC088548]|uniref:type I-E CRISPR-associated protein Cse1/CasA n=1 Tax=Kitasatospora sp. NPDC088548 TaxID=3364075 RepID=UPI00382353A8
MNTDTTRTASYNLLTEPWIPVTDADYGNTHVGIATALLEAHRLRLGSPGFDQQVLLRLLLAVLDAAAGPTSEAEWDTAWSAPTLPADRIRAYLDRWAPRFDLFGEQPFGQCAALTEANRDTHLLKPSRWGGHGREFLDHSLLEEPRPFEPAEAALALLRLQAFHPGGIQGAHPQDPRGKGGRIYGSKPGHASVVANLVVNSMGATLKDLLLLNLPPRPRAAGDRPVWEREAAGAAGEAREPQGRLDLWTWQTRRTRLFVDESSQVVGLALHDGDRMADPKACMHALDPLTARTTKGSPLPVTDAASFEVVWSAGLLLDPAGAATATSPVVEHVLLAAERGTLDPGLRLAAELLQVQHSNQHRASIFGIREVTSSLGTAASLATVGGRASLAAAARLAHDVQRALYGAGADAFRQQIKDIAPRQSASLARLMSNNHAWEDIAREPEPGLDRWTAALRRALDGVAQEMATTDLMATARFQVEAENILFRYSRRAKKTAAQAAVRTVVPAARAAA